MLKKLYLYCKNLFFNSKSDFSLTISLKPDHDIDIKVAYPTINEYDEYSILDLAEKYAKLFLYINSSALKIKLQNFLDDASSTEDIKTKIFFDNIIAFHDIMLNEIRAIKKQNKPLIRPISVFNSK